jgi:hypothetical protein
LLFVAITRPDRSTLLFESGADGQVDLVTDQRQVGFHAEIAALDLACKFKSHGEFLVQGVDTAAIQLGL